MGQLRDRSQFYFSLATVIDAGASPMSALRQQFLGKFQQAAVDIYGMIEDGGMMSVAMGKLPLFSSFECIFVAIGERTGRLGYALRTLGDWFDTRHAMRQRMISSLLYPMFLFYASGLIFTLIKYFSEEVSVLRCLIGFCIWSIIPFILGGFTGFFVKLAASKAWVGSFINRIPVLGELYFKQESMAFFKTLEMCLASGLGMTFSLRNASLVCGSEYFRERYGKLGGIIDRVGCPLSKAFTTIGLNARERNSVIMPLLTSGEMAGEVAEACERIATLHKEDTLKAMRRIAIGVPAVFYVLIAGYVAFRIVALFAQYISLINGLLE